MKPSIPVKAKFFIMNEFAQKPHILLVDDEQSIREIFSDYLHLKGYQITQARNGREALERLHRMTFDLIITDLNMPEINGVELIQKLREKNNSIPVIIITGFPSLDTAIRALKGGATDYLIKPINLEEISLKIKRVLEENLIRKESFLLKQLTRFLDFTYRLSMQSNLHLILQEVTHFLKETVNFDGIYLFTDFKNESGLVFQHTQHLNLPLPQNEFDRCIHLMSSSLQVLVTSSSINSEMSDKFSFTSTFHLGLIPLIAFNRLFGGIIISKVNIPYTDYYQQIMRMLANHMQTILENYVLNQDIRINYVATIQALTEAVDKKDPYTHYHSQNVMKLSLSLGKAFALSDEELEILTYAALLHDIGKIGIADSILNKIGKLTDEEYQIIKIHPVIGADIVKKVPSHRKLVPHILSHHERIDGKGYPHGLKNGEITLLAKIIAVADTFEAMFSSRVYRNALPLDYIREELIHVAGKQLDEMVVQKMIHIIDNNQLPVLQ